MIALLSGTDNIVAQSDVTPEEASGVTEVKQIADLLMKIENANQWFAFLLCFQNLLQEAQGVTIGQRLKDRAPKETPGPGQYKEKSHIVEGPQYPSYSHYSQYIK